MLFRSQISPVGGHPLERNPGSVARTLCIYDNAGESFQPGADRPDNPVTQHMAKSGCMMFVFDPTQDVRFRQRLHGVSGDPQLSSGTRTTRQDQLLVEMARRIRMHAGLAPQERIEKPLFVLLSKSDIWSDRKSTRLNSSHVSESRMPSSA